MVATFVMFNLETSLYIRLQYAHSFMVYHVANFHMCSASAYFFLAKRTEIKVTLAGSLCYFTLYKMFP
jgi:hypothetical protein